MLSKFPLLQKELINHAHNKQTYVMRIIYGIVLYSIFLTIWSDITRLSRFTLLGKGKRLLEVISYTNTIAILLILPNICAQTIVREKEQQTLDLLLVSPLRTTQILFEKYLSILFTSLLLIAMSFPLIYLSYLLGGVTSSDLVLSLYSLILTMFQITAIGAFCSCYFTSTTTAIIASYLSVFSLYILLPRIFFRTPPIYLLSHILLFAKDKHQLMHLYWGTSINWIFSIITIIFAAQLIPLQTIFSSKHLSIEKTSKSKNKYFKKSLHYNMPTKFNDYILLFCYCITAVFAMVTIVIILVGRYKNIINGHQITIFAIVFLVALLFAMLYSIKQSDVSLRFPIWWLQTRINRPKYTIHIIIFTAIICFRRYSLQTWNFQHLSSFSTLLLTMLVIITSNTLLFYKEKQKQRWHILLTTPIGISNIIWQKTLCMTKSTISIALILSLAIPRYSIPSYKDYSSYLTAFSYIWGYYFLCTLFVFISFQFVAMVFSTFSNTKNTHYVVGILMLCSLLPLSSLSDAYNSWLAPYNNNFFGIANKPQLVLLGIILCFFLAAYNLHYNSNKH
ncbi:ABC transporter permease [Candidatus Uabimicrobium sp. HlEnr_7]|uniref:ABC transporter permease n=1 Tax=Candidatus Uabimicrobium helgolandensis TaxID=3095367 RepID=UPI003557AC20